MSTSAAVNTAYTPDRSSPCGLSASRTGVPTSPYHGSFRQCLAYVRSRARGEVEGILGPRSLSWTVYRENALLVGSGRALLLQVAHPAVAEGVSQHSTFLADPIDRARRTYLAMGRLIFGDLHASLLTAKSVFDVHSHTHGVIHQETSARLAGRRYHAHDPELRLWVYAAMFDTHLLLYQALIRQMSYEEKERFYQEGKLLAALNGVPPHMVPDDLDNFKSYFHQMLTGASLEVGATARAICARLFQMPDAPARKGAILPASLLPSTIRHAYGFRWTSRQQRVLPALWRMMGHAFVRLPAIFRYAPTYHLAMARIANAQGTRPTISSRLVNHLARIAPLPFNLLPAAGPQPATKP